jgi:hypothetical protein
LRDKTSDAAAARCRRASVFALRYDFRHICIVGLLLSLAVTFRVPGFAATIEALQTIPLMCFGSGEMSGYENPYKEIAKIARIKRKYSWHSLSTGEISLSGRRKERNRYEPPRPLTVRVGRRTVRTSNAAPYLLICADRQHRTFRCVENK